MYATGSGGYSYLIVTGPPPPDKRTHPLTCSTNSVAPMVDIMLVGVQWSIRRGRVGWWRRVSTHPEPGLGVLLLSSAVTGISRMKACIAAKTAETKDAAARVAAAAAQAAGAAAAAASGSAASKPAAQPVVPAPATP